MHNHMAGFWYLRALYNNIYFKLFIVKCLFASLLLLFLQKNVSQNDQLSSLFIKFVLRHRRFICILQLMSESEMVLNADELKVDFRSK